MDALQCCLLCRGFARAALDPERQDLHVDCTSCGAYQATQGAVQELGAQGQDRRDHLKAWVAYRTAAGAMRPRIIARMVDNPPIVKERE